MIIQLKEGIKKSICWDDKMCVGSKFNLFFIAQLGLGILITLNLSLFCCLNSAQNRLANSENRMRLNFRKPAHWEKSRSSNESSFKIGFWLWIFLARDWQFWTCEQKLCHIWFLKIHFGKAEKNKRDLMC